MTELEAFWDTCWQALEDALAGKDNPMRQVTLATSTNGRPDARILILRGVDRAKGMIEVHTDLFSSKINDLKANPNAVFLAWSPTRQLQLRLFADISVQSGSAVRDLWEKVPETSRLGYGGTQPGSPIDSHKPRGPADSERFAVIQGHVNRVDALELGSPYHRRAIFEASDGFTGRWVSP